MVRKKVFTTSSFQMRQFLQILPPQNFISSHFAKEIDFSLRNAYLALILKKGGQCSRKSIHFLRRSTARHPSSSKSPIVIPKVALLSGHLTYNRQVVICAHLCRSRSEDPIN